MLAILQNIISSDRSNLNDNYLHNYLCILLNNYYNKRYNNYHMDLKKIDCCS